MKTLFPPALGDTLQAQLATVLYEKGSKAEAQDRRPAGLPRLGRADSARHGGPVKLCGRS